MKFHSVVVDTNLIFSALVSKSSGIRDILFENSITFYCPNYLITEIYTHKEKLLKVSKLSQAELYLYFNGIMERINFVPLDFISTASRQKAYDLCKNVDFKDIPFVALAIELGAPIWTGDKKLKTGLRLNNFENFYEP